MPVRKTANKNALKPGSVSEYMRSLPPPQQQQTRAIRRIILGVDPRITEEIKWNAPSFALGEHFVTFNGWAKDYVQLIFHHGPKKVTKKGIPIDDPDGLLEWLATDRASVRFDSMKDVTSKKAGLQKIIKLWIQAMGRP